MFTEYFVENKLEQLYRYKYLFCTCELCGSFIGRH